MTTTSKSKSGPIGLAVIGTGGFGRGMAERIAGSQKLSLISCYDVSQDSCKQVAEQFGCRAASSIDEVLNDDSVEGVVIVTPNFAHRENTLDAAAAGKHVFVDKPIANEIEDAYAMIDACRNAGVTLAVGHNFRRYGSHRKLKELVDAGVAGTIVGAEGNFSHAGGMGLTPNLWRYYPEKAPALPLIQLGVHCADTMQCALGPIAEVSSFMAHRAIPGENVDVTASVLRFESGVVGYLGSNYATPSIYYVNIHGTAASLYSSWGAPVRIVWARGKGEEVVEGVCVDERTEELEEFGDCIRTGAKPEVTGEVGLLNLAVVRAALKSAQEGRPVKLKELLAR
ncbi:MAG: Gfo/Idh/MocA family oxidoreductase [Armatimonadota bacterium]|nr:Gfo/Idh/MocA family oxidoreductase [Armatimonadota bacterium]